MTDPVITVPGLPPPPKIPTGQELYDSIMGNIEPELTSTQVNTLDAKYAGETPEQNAARKQRYQLAFERYEEAYNGYIETLDTQVTRYCHNAYKQVEMQDQEEEAGVLDQLSRSFLQA